MPDRIVKARVCRLKWEDVTYVNVMQLEALVRDFAGTQQDEVARGAVLAIADSLGIVVSGEEDA